MLTDQTIRVADRIELLWRFFPRRGASLAELGVKDGHFADIILNVCHPAQLLLVDCWQFQPGPYELDHADVPQVQQEQRYRRVVQRFATRPEVKILRAFTHHAAPAIADGSLDALYLDACHLQEAVTQDLNDWWPKLKPGGVLAGHDYHNLRPGTENCIQVRPAVDAFCAQQGLTLAAVSNEPFGSWAVLKP